MGAFALLFPHRRSRYGILIYLCSIVNIVTEAGIAPAPESV